MITQTMVQCFVPSVQAVTKPLYLLQLAIYISPGNLHNIAWWSHGNGLVVLPLLVGLGVVDKDDKVVVLALVVELVLGSLAASHCVGWEGVVEM